MSPMKRTYTKIFAFVLFICIGNSNLMIFSRNFRLFGCELCDRKFFREMDVVEHTRRSHPVSLKSAVAPKLIGENGGIFDPACVCSRCGKKFASKAYVDNHERSCDGMFVRQPKFTQSKVCAMLSIHHNLGSFAYSIMYLLPAAKLAGMWMIKSGLEEEELR